MPDARMTTCTVRFDPPLAENGELENADRSTSAAIASFPGTVFLYQEQALSNQLDKPYRQRLLRISANAEREAVESAGFELTDPKASIGLCSLPEAERAIAPSQLGSYRCSVFLQPVAGSVLTYLGNTPEEGCLSNYRGVVRVFNTISSFSHGHEYLGSRLQR
ncbi:MAG: hypothetical protein HC925_07080 [Coleofasciculaceae cyanobacterium SM2_3_26]|nr:hypothetical protein [Coleofasciculaceae cyanobacterium SM2_3_26]